MILFKVFYPHQNRILFNKTKKKFEQFKIAYHLSLLFCWVKFSLIWKIWNFAMTAHFVHTFRNDWSVKVLITVNFCHKNLLEEIILNIVQIWDSSGTDQIKHDENFSLKSKFFFISVGVDRLPTTWNLTVIRSARKRERGKEKSFNLTEIIRKISSVEDIHQESLYDCDRILAFFSIFSTKNTYTYRVNIICIENSKANLGHLNKI